MTQNHTGNDVIKSNFLRNRTLAIVVLLVVLIGGTLFGSWRSLTAQRRSYSEIFYVGEDESGYGIATNLNLRIEYARNLCKIAADYDASAECINVESACVALEDTENFSEKYRVNQALTDAVDLLDRRMQQLPLSEEDENWRISLTTDIASYEMRIDKLASAFNSGARHFNEDILGAFPANLFGRLTGVKKVEEYA